jgi:tetratricopeptide (TPR) repeat protein
MAESTATMKKQSKKLTQLLTEAKKQIDAQDWSAALALMLQAKTLDEENYALLFQLGWAHIQLGQPTQALSFFEKVETIASKNSVVLNSVGIAYMRLNLWPAALRVLLQSMDLDASYIDTYLNLAKVYYNLQDHKKSLDVSMKAILLDISNVSVHLNMGAALLAMGFLKEARIAFETCISLDSGSLDALFNLALINSQEGNRFKAINDYRTYLSMAEATSDQNINVARYYLGIELLKNGELKEGWSLYDNGFDPFIPAYGARAPARRFLVPRWQGQPIPGQRLLVWAEQGIGDEILFMSCMKDVLATATNVILECDSRLVPVMARSFPSVTVRASAYDPGNFNASLFNDFDYHIPLGSLAGLYRQTLQDFDRSLPYVVTDAAVKERFGQRLTGFDGKLKVGICWRSGMLNAERNKHYTAIIDWGELLKLPNCVFVNLQYGDCEAELVEAETRFGISILRWPDLDLKNHIADSLALIECLDLVVTTGTAVHSMAGSLGKPTLMMLAEWGLGNFGSDHYPWNPNTRCFVPSQGQILATVIPQVTEVVKILSA